MQQIIKKKKKNVVDTIKKGNRVCPIGLLLFSTEHLPNLPPPATQKDFSLVPFSLSFFHSISVSSFFFFFPTLDSQMVGSDLHAFA